MLVRAMRVVAFVVCLVILGGSAHAQDSDPGEGVTQEEAAKEDAIDKGGAEDGGWTLAEPWSTEGYEQLRSTQSVLEYSAAGALAITAGFGAATYLNRPTLTGDGRCREGDPIFGSYGCSGLSTLHGILGVGTSAIYLSAGIMELTLPDRPPGQSGGAFDSSLTPVHVTSMAILPLLGILASEPQTLDIDPAARLDFSRTARTMHAGLAVFTAGVYIASFFVD